jgi:hypothetical protein
MHGAWDIVFEVSIIGGCRKLGCHFVSLQELNC